VLITSHEDEPSRESALISGGRDRMKGSRYTGHLSRKVAEPEHEAFAQP